MKIKVGIFFGGPSREREISFAGGRTVYDNLNKSIFEPLPIFVDSQKQFIELEWQYVYKGSIRDFYPPIDSLPTSPNAFQIYADSLEGLDHDQQQHLIEKVGKPLLPEELSKRIDVAFLALHGEYGEDGTIQQELQDLGIPYTGSGVEASKVGIDKALQKELMQEKGFDQPKMQVIDKNSWVEGNPSAIFQEAIDLMAFPMVVRPARQGSSIGVTIINEDAELGTFEKAVNRAFFRELLLVDEWLEYSETEQVEYVRELADLRDGLGFPLDIELEETTATLYHPEQLLKWLNEQAGENTKGQLITLEGHHTEEKVLIEAFIHGKEFSCIVIRQEDGGATALPPTEIRKGKEVFDYRSKYLPGLSRKVTPIDLADEDINNIRAACERLFTELDFQVYARIDGFITDEGQVLLNDPNTTSGMLPSSFFFHQAAEIGLNPSQFLTYIIRVSLQERLKEWEDQEQLASLMEQLDEAIVSLKSTAQQRTIGVILGGYSYERHISVESGRNIYEKLSSSAYFRPIPIFLLGNADDYSFYQLPVNLLLKDNADDIRDKILHFEEHPVVELIKQECEAITSKYASDQVVFRPNQLSLEQIEDMVDGVFIAIHGRPGEDGQLQMALEARNIPYNGSGIQSSSITIDKYKTLQLLRQHGFSVADQLLLKRGDYEDDPQEFFDRVESRYRYPFVAKPVDDGCSSAVKVIRSREALEAYTRLLFRPLGQEGAEARRILGLSQKEEFPYKSEILFENLIGQNGAQHFLEITGGLVTQYDPNGVVRYEVFEPSETLTTGEVLTLEEKFLAGEGQNITPARFSKDEAQARLLSGQVRSELEKAARILGIEGYARIDAFVRVHEGNKAETIIIEVNSLPGMTPATCIFHQAALNEYRPDEFIEQIINFGFQRERFKAIPQPTPKATPVAKPAAAATTIPPITATPPPPPVPEAPAPVVEDPFDDDFSMQNSGKSVSIFKYLADSLKGGFGMIFKRIWNFMKSGIFIRNLVALLLAVGILFYLTQQWLRLYTNHGESLEVENYENLPLEAAIRKAERRSFSIVITDSIYLVDRRPNIVLKQDPIAGSRVKENRRIYLTITKSTPPPVPLPDLMSSGYDYFQYTKNLERLGLKYRIREREFNKKLSENQILYFYYKDQKITDQDLRDGIEVPKGSELEFVITRRFMDQVPIPNLVCKKYEAASFLITSNNLAIGNISGDVSNRQSAYVWKQEPTFQPGVMIQTGQQIDLYLTQSRPSGCRTELDPSDLDDSSSDQDEQGNN